MMFCSISFRNPSSRDVGSAKYYFSAVAAARVGQTHRAMRGRCRQKSNDGLVFKSTLQLLDGNDI